jgi:hypothetical protein
VPQSLLDRSLIRATLQFGFELGTGVRTYVSSTAPYLVAVAVLLVANDATAATVAGVGFGLGRLAMPLARSLSYADEAWDAALARRSSLLVPAAGAACALLAFLLALGAAGAGPLAG